MKEPKNKHTRNKTNKLPKDIRTAEKQPNQTTTIDKKKKSNREKRSDAAR